MTHDQRVGLKDDFDEEEYAYDATYDGQGEVKIQVRIARGEFRAHLSSQLKSSNVRSHFSQADDGDAE